MVDSQDLAAVAAVIRSAQRFLVISHQNPDADAYGASWGLALAAREQGKEVAVANVTGVIARYKFIKGVSETQREIPAGDWPTVVIVDCGDRPRVGDAFLPWVSAHHCVVNIDHHITNDRFGIANVVAPNASSSSEIIFELLKELKWRISASVASALFAGIVGDTGSFRYLSTSPQTLRVASELLELGADLKLISTELYGSESPAAVKLQSEAMSKVEFLAAGKIAVVTVMAEAYARHGAEREDGDVLVERARDIRGVLIACLLKEDGELWKISLRAKDERLDVSSIATEFGGGGHRQAAAFRTKKDLATVRGTLLPRLEKAVTAFS